MLQIVERRRSSGSGPAPASPAAGSQWTKSSNVIIRNLVIAKAAGTDAIPASCLRFGAGHAHDDYFHAVTGSAVHSRMNAQFLAQNNVFESTKVCLETTGDSDVDGTVFLHAGTGFDGQGERHGGRGRRPDLTGGGPFGQFE